MGETLAAAVAAHRAGHIDDARHRYDTVLAIEPRNGWANFFRGLLAREEGDVPLARTLLGRACDAPDARPQFHVELGNLELAGRNDESAAAAFRAAIKLSPDFAAAHTGLCLALKHLGDLASAADSSARALHLRRGWTRTPGFLGRVDSAEAAAMRRTNRTKLRHDVDQLRHLRATDRLGPEAEPVIAGLEALLKRYAALPGEMTIIELTEADLALTQFAYSRIMHLEPAPGLSGPVLNAASFAAADEAVAGAPTGIAVVDSALIPNALSTLQSLVVNSTIWFEIKDHGGHLGAYFEEGLACGLTTQIADALRRALPRTLGSRRLAQLWAYKYEAGFGGTELHADVGAVSANLWITPDAANLDLSGGGLTIFPALLPSDWDFRRMNVDRHELERFAADSGVTPVSIPYRCNRIVLFNARLLHRTAPHCFGPNYADRRTNLTFLFE